jgi:hypothetical protein
MDITDEVMDEVIKDVQETEVSKKPVKVKIDYDGYYLVDTIDCDGNKTSIPARGYNLKSWLNFEKSLKMNVSVEYRQVIESEYLKYHWTSFDMSDEVVEIESAGDGNRQSEFTNKPKKPIVSKKTKMDVDKVAKTDRNIGDITAFME